jgi:hypothetical protein
MDHASGPVLFPSYFVYLFGFLLVLNLVLNGFFHLGTRTPWSRSHEVGINATEDVSRQQIRGSRT